MKASGPARKPSWRTGAPTTCSRYSVRSSAPSRGSAAPRADCAPVSNTLRFPSIYPDCCVIYAALNNKPDQICKETGQPKPAFFRDKSGLSVDLARFSNPERSRIGHAEKPYPRETGLIELTVRRVRDAGSDVGHVPVSAPRRNYAHAQFTSVPGSSGLDQLSKGARYKIQQRFKAPTTPTPGA